jgi:DNA-binding LytR/AlgR family response regulator
MNTEKLTCYIVDDDKISLKILESLVLKTDFLKLLSVFDDPLEASKALSDSKVDLLFLDVEMPEMNGFELLKNIEQKPQIILTTSKPQYAVDAFDFEVVDFLLKPILNYGRFLKAVRKAKANHDKLAKASEVSINNNDNNKQIFIKVDSLLVNFKLEDILYFEASGDYVKIYCNEKTIVVHSKLRTIEEKLPPLDFIRVHRSYIVRLDKIKNIDNANIQIGNNIIPVSSSYRTSLMRKIKTLN